MAKITVDAKKCIGCAACVAVCDKVFELKNGKAIVKKYTGKEKCIQEAADSCPVSAISIK